MNPEPTRPSGPIIWRRVSRWAIRSRCGWYAVSRSTVVAEEFYCAWFGLPLREQPRETSRMPEILGIYPDPAQAKQACEDHALLAAGEAAP